jgi:hypothetical protein
MSAMRFAMGAPRIRVDSERETQCKKSNCHAPAAPSCTNALISLGFSRVSTGLTGTDGAPQRDADERITAAMYFLPARDASVRRRKIAAPDLAGRARPDVAESRLRRRQRLLALLQ